MMVSLWNYFKAYWDIILDNYLNMYREDIREGTFK